MAKTGRPCNVCKHPMREVIDTWLVAKSMTHTGISATYPELSTLSISNHARKHVSKLLAEATQRHLIAHGDKLADQVRAVLDMIQADLDTTQDVELRAKLYPRFSELFKVLGFTTGQLSSGGTTVNLQVNNVVQEARGMTDQEVAARAQAMLKAYNRRYPTEALYVDRPQEADVVR